MKIRRRVAAVAAGTALIASIPVVMAGTAQAATPPWEPDPASLGGVSFYDATGHLLTGGTNLSHIADYIAASSGPSTPTAFKATLYFAAPDHTKTPDQWFVQQASASKTFPNASAPAPLTGPGFTKPLVTTNAAEGNLSTFLNAATLDSTAGYANLIQVRVFDNTSDPSYWSADISYDTAAGTWTQVFPVVSAPTSTTTSLQVTPASPQVAGTTLTLTATVTPTAAAGTVQFMDGATNLGSANVSGGTAQITDSTLPAGSHSLTAVFQPADTTAFSGSTSTAVPYTITSPAVTTTTAVSALPVSPVVSGTSVVFTATVTPASAVGSVQFKDGATNLGSPVAVSGGTAALAATTTLTVGTHSITAAFTPTNPANFTASTSSALSYTITAPAVTTTTSVLGNPPSPVVSGTSVVFTATVTPASAVGSVQFKDGATNLGSPVAVSGGTAALPATTTLTVGTHSITAAFTPTNPANFTASTSSALSFTVNAAGPTSTTTALNVLPTSPAAHGSTETLTATVTPSGAAGTVKFMDGATQVGSTQVLFTGSASVTAVLADGAHSLTAVFTPTDATAFTASTSTAVSYSVTPAGPVSTSTALNVTPLSPAAHGSTETLTATVTPSGAAGTVTFMDGATQVGSTQPVAAGSASVSAVLADGAHSLTAVFTPTDATAFTASTSTAVSYTVNPAGATTTTTALNVTPPSPAAHGTSEMLTATVTPSGAAGTVAFMDGATQVGSTLPVAAGSASLSAVLADGAHSLTAVFTPTDPTAFTASTSSAVDYSVTPAGPVATTTALGVTPASPASSGATETLTATVTPSDAAGTVAFMDGATQVGSTQAVAAGTAAVSAVLADGAHSLTAVFTPADATAFSGSTSAAVPYDVTPAGATSTTTVLDVMPASPASSGATETLTATVTPSDAVGTVAFMDGATQVGSTQSVAAGSASVSVVLADGSHSLTAVFSPTDPTAFAASTSDPVSYEVTGVGPVATTTDLTVSPSSPASHGATETLTATVTPSGAAGTIGFFDGSTQLGTTQTVSAGSASLDVVLGDGAHSLMAVFTPTDATAFASSTSTAVSYTVNAGSSAHRTRLHLTVWPKDPTVVGRRVFMAATISPPWAHGQVEFFSGGRLLGVAHLKDGVAKFSTDDLKVGSHGLWARYVPFNPDNFRKSASNSVRIQVLPMPCKRRGHSDDASPAVFFAGRALQPPAGFDAVPVASTSPIAASSNSGTATGTAAVLVLGLLVSGAASILVTRRGTAPGRGPTAD